MADRKPTSNMYNMLGGVNEKASDYSTGKAQFLNLRNVDFHVPNALQKRQGSTKAVTTGTSGPIRSLFEFEKLTGESYVVAGSDTALFYLAANAYTLLDAGWDNGQPPDMLAFLNKLWVANGENIKSWNGSTVRPFDLPYAFFGIGSTTTGSSFDTGSGASIWSVFGITHAPTASGNPVVGFFVSASYVRDDGFFGPCDPRNLARELNRSIPQSSVDLATFTISGLTAPSGYGISQIAIWVAAERAENQDYVLQTTPKVNTITPGLVWGGNAVSELADLSKFKLYTLLPASTSTFIMAFEQGFTAFFKDASTITFDLNTFSLRNKNWPLSGANEFSLVPKYLDVNQNVMFMSGFSPAPSDVMFTDLAEPESVHGDLRFEARTNDGDQVRAIKTFNNQMLILKERSFHKVVGDNADNYQLVELSTQYGCISKKSVVEFKENLLWLDRQGILEFNGSSWEIISTPVEDTFRRMNLSAAREKACGVHVPFRNQVWFGIPVDGSTENNLTVVYDYLIGAWTFFDGFNAASFAFIKSGLTVPTVWRGDYSGLVHYHSESLFGDNGAGITCLGLTPFEKSKENEENIWRRFFLDVTPASGLTSPITIELFTNYNRSTVGATRTIYQSQFQSRAEFGLPAKSIAAQFSHHSASLPFLMNGFSWTRRFLRNV